MKIRSDKSGRPLNLSKLPFEELGDSYHFIIDSYHDLQLVESLDEALWIATTAPVSTLKIDRIFLELLDSDGDGRLRPEEIKAGIRFLFDYLDDYSMISPEHLELPIQAIKTGTPLGDSIRSSAEKVIKRLSPSAETVSLAQIRSVKKEVLDGGLDQAGIVLPEAAGDGKTARLIDDILRSVGGLTHANGGTGVDGNGLTRFFEECRNYLDWWMEAGEIKHSDSTVILPLGSKTEQGYAILKALETKLTQFFLLCDIKRLNPEKLSHSIENSENNTPSNLLKIKDAESYLAEAPLSYLNPEGILDLSGDLNPYFLKTVHNFSEKVAKPLLGRDITTINKDNLTTLRKRFKPFEQWMQKKPDVKVDILDIEAITSYLSEPEYLTSMNELLAESHRLAFILENLKELERLVLYQAYMLPLVNSFVSFPSLYSPDERALFEEGTLVMDGRHFSLAIKVEDREHHIETSKSSNIFVIYCELFGDDGRKTGEIAVPVTTGGRGNIHLNKWGIFNDIDGNELHARVVDIVENPISVREAIADPFIRLYRSFFTRLEEFSSKAEERLLKRGEKVQEKKKNMPSSGGLLAGGGVAVAALGSSFAFIAKTFSGMTLETVLISILVVITLITIPTGIAAYYKLSRRDLSTILEGSGWGINARMKLTRNQSHTFTRKPRYRSKT